MTEKEKNKEKATEKTVEKVKDTRKQIKFCPKCGSDNINIETSVADAHDYCGDCGLNFSKNGPVLLVSFPIREKIN